MREKLATLIACPICLKPLTFDGKTGGDRFVNGSFKCSSGHVYQVKEQIGMFKDAKTSAKEFEWKVNVADEKKYAEVRKEYDSYLTQEQKVSTQILKNKLADFVVRSNAESERPVLDVATGMGTFLAPLLEKLPNKASIVGTDIDEKPLRGLMNKTMKAGTYPKLSLLVTDAKHLCFRDSAVSTISSFFGFDNVPETVSALKEACRVLGDGGNVFLASIWYEEGSKSMRIAEEHGVCEIASAERLKESLLKSGLVLDTIEEVFSGIWPYNPMDLLPVEGDEYKHVIAHASKPKN
jgi:ubiquinone/menaquinone biosynthesis C-methylase UbiE